MKPIYATRVQCPSCAAPVECRVEHEQSTAKGGSVKVTIADPIEAIKEHVRRGECGRRPGGPKITFYDRNERGELVAVVPRG
ncbi:hypothetical protein SEA_JULIETTE_7 [Mycobacterium phage Juliette]|uniref:Uncharacterized protein n=1 Tax=Mycobacterium phage Eponine TaxID=2708631 RepID=A0A6G6XT66_9CAUD|nr:hypothetical protein I5G69_gp07 [Mycobacterium phage Eponine]QIG61788.1 hypothetical protein SEA_EPONINE_7 [Mycobacterium phage Eponine]QTF81614.1 hypothetical protein SEA_JULIETTE_7 [Mycobacterium phage Juliette]